MSRTQERHGVPRRRAARFAALAALGAGGGGLWTASGLPLGWLMGAAAVAGLLAARGWTVETPRPLYNGALAVIGAGVGLTITPAAALELAQWGAIMPVAALLGVVLAAAAAPLLARWAKMRAVTAYFALLPGGVIEMARIGETHGADRTTIAALHALRVAMIVSLLPLALFALSPTPQTGGALAAQAPEPLGVAALIGALALALAGGWAADRLGTPAGWLLGAVVAVGAAAGAGVLGGALPPLLLIGAQIVLGLSLGARFKREMLRALPRALAAAAPVFLALMALTALAGVVVAAIGPVSEPIQTLVLCFSIGGMAEMVLTAKALGQNAALVAAFQAVRAVLVNLCAGAVWRRLSRHALFSS